MSNSNGRLFYNCAKFVRERIAQPCALCGRRSVGSAVCPACLETLPRLPAGICPVCAQPTPLAEVCGACLKRPPAFDRTVAAFRYGPPLDELVRSFKYGGELALAEFFADRLAGTLAGRALPDRLIPMPLYPARTRERGFNQAVELGRALARRLDLPLDVQACRRMRATTPQAGLDLKARRRNLRGAFACDGSLDGLAVALLDDVMTTGSSLDELARTARRAGASRIEVWVLARAVRR